MANQIIEAVYRLKDEITGGLKRITDGLRGNRVESDKTADASERNARRTSQAYKQAAEGIGALRGALVALGAFVGLEKIKSGIEAVLEAGEGFDDLQKRFTTAFGSADAGAAALERVRAIAATVPQSFEDVSAAAIRLRQLGFDPLDGTLQTLLDNQNALDQSQEGLIATIEALGKASVRGEVNVKALVALTEQGVPVFELLGKSMGISADRVRELAESGKLGQDSIKLLVSELGRLRAGAAADEMSDLDAQLTKLRDTSRQFLETIANSGSLDFFRKAIADFNTEVQEAAKSGRLQEIAKSVSDGIVSGAKAIGSAGRFLVDHAGAVVTLTKAYAAFKIGGIALDLAKVSLGFKDTAKSAAEAAKSAEKVGTSVKGIPGNVRIALALVGFDLAVAAGEKLGDIISETSGETEKWQKVQEGLREEIRQTAIHFAEVANRLSQYRDVQVLAAKDVANLSDAEREAYAERLAGLQKYLQAQVFYLRNLDRAGLAGKEEKDRLVALTSQFEAVARAQVAFTEGAQAATDALANGLTPSAQLLANRLAEVARDGKAAGDLIAKAFEGFDLQAQLRDVGDFALAFDNVAAKGGQAGDTLNRTLLDSLKKLSGEDLQRFQTGAAFALAAVGDGAEKTSATLKDVLEVALDRLKVKAEDTGVAITKSGADTIATFATVAQNAQASAQTITAAFDAALAGVKTKDEANAIGAALQAAAAQGKVSFRELADSTVSLNERLRTISANLSPLASQFEVLGIKSQAQLIAVRDNARDAFNAVVEGARRGEAAQEDVVRAFKAHADAERAAVADSTESVRKQVEQQLELEATIFGLTDALGKAGDAGKAAGDTTSEAFHGAKDAIDDTAHAASNLAENAKDAASGVGGIGSAAQSTTTLLSAATQGIILLSAEQLRGLREIGDELEAGALSLAEYEQRIADVMGGTNEAIQRQIEQLQRLRDREQDLRSQIAQENGDATTQENIRHEQALKNLRDEATVDGSLNTAEYQRLKRLEDELHELKLKHIREQQKARADSDRSSGGGSGSSADGGVGNAPGAPTPRAAPSINAMPNVLLLSADKEAARKLAQMLARDMKRELDDIARRST